MGRWRIDVEYDGTDFAGWQVQPDQRTIQGCLTEAAARFLGEPVRIDGAGRTDSGVHALQQVAAFNTSAKRSAGKVPAGFNAYLPDAIAVTAAEEVSEDFHPRHSRHTKCYRYRWLDRGLRSPLRAHQVWLVHRPLDAEAMALAAQCMLGTHDFSSFRAAGCASTHPIRTIEGVTVVRAGDEVRLEIQGTGFLRHMVRILAGHLYEIGRGAHPPDWLVQVREGHQRVPAGRTAPAEGLCLQWIRYGEHAPPRSES